MSRAFRHFLTFCRLPWADKPRSTFPPNQIVRGENLRIAIVGTSGSGKTTLAQQIATVLGIPHIELDALHWEANWVEADPVVFRQRVMAAIAGDQWVIDGNYSAVRSIVWERATALIWLNLPLYQVLSQVTWRTLKRGLYQTELWNGNRESLRQGFCSRDSMILWVLRTYHHRRREYPKLISQPEYQHLEVVEVRSHTAAQAWLKSLIPSPPASHAS